MSLDTHNYSQQQFSDEDEVINYAYENFINSLKEADEESAAKGDIFSRACLSCHNNSPSIRVVSSSCGHAVCRECASVSRVACPVCRTPTHFVPLIEEPRAPRACSCCFWHAPLERLVFSGCGHAVCRACAWRLRGMGVGGNVFCDHCQVQSSFVPMIEEVINEPIDNLIQNFANLH